MSIHTTKALLLKSTPFKEKDHIVQALTMEMGLQSFYLKRRMVALPTLVEIEYHPSASIHRIQQWCTLKSYEKLRESFNAIKSAGKMSNYFQKIQFPGMNSPHLFSLMDQLFSWIDKENALLCLSIFLTKILKFEGSFLIKNDCSICGQTLQRFFIDGSQWLCEKHQANAICFDKIEVDWIESLMSMKTKKEMARLTISEPFCRKLEDLFCKHFEITQGDKNGDFSRRRDPNFV